MNRCLFLKWILKRVQNDLYIIFWIALIFSVIYLIGDLNTIP